MLIMWQGKIVSVILPTFNEPNSIKKVVNDYFQTKLVDEVIVINNNAVQGTDTEIKKTKALLVYEKKQGYGFAIRKGIKKAKGDILIISEPDGTFNAQDIHILLAYHQDGFEVVFGTRTTKGLIWEGANMGFFLKWGNILVAKLVEILFFSRCQLTDVGCTLKLFSKKSLKKLEPHFTTGGSAFGLELIILTLLKRINFVEVPVNYFPRVGKSSVTGSWFKTLILSIQMIILVIKYRLKTKLI